MSLDFLAPSYAFKASFRDQRLACTATASLNAEPKSSAPRRKPLHARTPSPSTSMSPVDILTKVRTTSKSPTSNPDAATSFSVDQHNRAVQSLLAGLRFKNPKDRYNKAFVQGWLPIKTAGNAARPRPEDLGFVLESTHDKLRLDGSTEAWRQIKELALWLAGEPDCPGLTGWSWRQVQSEGTAGAQRVIEIWDALERNEHARLRQGEHALDHAFKSQRSFQRCIINSNSPQPSHFRDLVASLLRPGAPLLKNFLDKKSSNGVLKLLPATSSPLARLWLRQTTLAQMWFGSRRRLPGFEIVRLARACFRTGNTAQAWSLWELIQEGVANPQINWIKTDRWSETATDKLIAETIETKLAENGGSTFSEDQEFMSRDNEIDDTESEISLSTPSTQTLADASLSQSIVVPFLTGFTRAEIYDKASQIWAWLLTNQLAPGVALWNSLMFGYATRGDVAAVEAVLRDMRDEGVQPDVDTWINQITAHFESRRPDDAMDVAGAILRELGGQVPSVVYDRLILGLLGNGRAEQAEDVLKQMDEQGAKVTVHTINNLLRFYTRGRKPNLPAIVRCITSISERGLEADVFTYTMVLQSLLAAGHKDAVTRVVQMMDASGIKPTPTTYGTIIHALASSGEADKLEASIKLVDEMETRGMASNEIIYTSLIQGFLRAASSSPRHGGSSGDRNQLHPYIEAAFQLKERMQERGLTFNRIAYNAIIDAALSLKTNDGVELAMALFREMQNHRKLWREGETDQQGLIVTPAQTWTVLLSGLANMGEWRLARQLVAEMETSGFKVHSRALERIVDKIQRGGRVI
ncbi:hypothetical protein OIO90_006486 [Microbotryomycetes sp. JL221]|nr:hypothetical protein OIO90_006486 [Microbotryomycetes sp. JL221]